MLGRQSQYIVCHALLVGLFTFESLATEKLFQFVKWKFTPSDGRPEVMYYKITYFINHLTQINVKVQN